MNLKTFPGNFNNRIILYLILTKTLIIEFRISFVRLFRFENTNLKQTLKKEKGTYQEVSRKTCAIAYFDFPAGFLRSYLKLNTLKYFKGFNK